MKHVPLYYKEPSSPAHFWVTQAFSDETRPRKHEFVIFSVSLVVKHFSINVVQPPALSFIADLLLYISVQ